MSRKAILLLLASVLVAPAAATAQVVKTGDNLVTVTVAGQGTDKDEALRDAMRKAVEQGAGTVIHSHSETKDFVLVRDTILARAAGFIQSYKVLSEKRLEDGIWEVRISAEVSVNGVEDMWGAVTTLLGQLGRPKIMVFLRERIDDRKVEDSTVQARIENLLLASGFLLVDKEQIKAIEEKDLAAAFAEDKPDRMQAIAKRFGAQLFITGSANAMVGESKTVAGVLIHAYQAEANVRCYRSDTAQLLSSIPGEPVRSADREPRSAAKKALDLQAQQLAPKVQQDILRFWQDALSGRGEVQLKVEGITFKQYLDLKKALGKLKNVKDVKAEFANNVADCSIQTDLRAEALAEKLVEAFGDLEITDVSQNVIKATLSK